MEYTTEKVEVTIEDILSSTTFLFDGKETYHMLNCYNDKSKHRPWRNIAIDMFRHPKWEVCVTNKDSVWTEYALILKGDVTAAYTEDVFSYVNENGERCADKKFAHLTCDTLDEWDRATLPEAFVKNTDIIGVMVYLNKRGTKEKRMAKLKEAYTFCQQFGLELHVWTSDIKNGDHINIQRKRYL